MQRTLPPPMPDHEPDIKSKLPPNIRVGGEIINTGDMEINGETMPQTSPAQPHP